MDIRIETYEITVIRLRPHVKLFCATCRTMTPHLAIDQAALILAVPASEISALADAGKIRAAAGSFNRAFFCGESLATLR